MTVTIRESRAGDCPQILTIYNDVLANSNAIYSETPGTLDYIEQWRAQRIDSGYPLFVAERNDLLCGYGTFGQFRARPGYRFTVEHTVHVASDGRGQGAGTALMKALIARARLDGYHVMIGAVDSGNAQSLNFHRRLGFHVHDSINQVGVKGGNWLNLSFVSLILDANPPQ